MISIAMTTYNGSKYIKNQIDSILNQTYKDFELIICDDCSTDNTREILTDYKNKDNRIKLFFNEINLGFKKNFEYSISLCTYDYIALSDQDDIWSNNHLEKLITLIKDYDIACGNAELIDTDDNKLNIKLNETDNLLVFNNTDKLLYRTLGNSNCFQGASMLLKKDFLNKCLPIPENIPFHDVWFALCSCFNHKITYSFDIINFYRQHESQITNHVKQSFLQKFKDYFKYLFTQKKYTTDRFLYIEEINKRFNISEEQLKIIDDCKKIQLIKTKQFNFFKRIKYISIFRKNYTDIYTQENSKFRFFRTIRFLF